MIMNTGMKAYLIGGGWRAETFGSTYGRFVEAARSDAVRKIIQIIVLEVEEDEAEMVGRYREPFLTLAVKSEEINTIVVTKKRPLNMEEIVSLNPTGIFVCGGLTPLYQECLCTDEEIKEFIVSRKIPYGGFSAGSAIFSAKALVGGWRIVRGEKSLPIVDEEVSENLDNVEIRKGLGLVPFSIDVHCGQWGTITRLIHAVNTGLTDVGIGIDEDTMIEIDGEDATVRGSGQVYKITRGKADDISVRIYRAGDRIFDNSQTTR